MNPVQTGSPREAGSGRRDLSEIWESFFDRFDGFDGDWGVDFAAEAGNARRGARPSPARVFDLVADGGGGALEGRIENAFLILGRPGDRLEGDLSEGDVLLSRALGEGALCGMEVIGPQGAEPLVPGGRLCHNQVALRPRVAESLPGEQQAAPDSPVADRFVAAHRSRFCTPGQAGSATCAALASPRPIRRVVIHVVAVPSTARRNGVEAVVAGWQLPPRDRRRPSSAHYLVDRDGTITQMVREADAAFHTPGANADSIGIEHADVCNDPAPLTTRLYERSAALVRDLARRHDFRINDQTVAGHRDVAGNHEDPGSYWDWEYYRLLLAWDGATLASRPLREVTSAAARGAPPSGWQAQARRPIANDRCANRRDPWGARYWRAQPNAGGNAAELVLVAPEAGTFKVSLWWPDVSGANPSVPVDVEVGCFQSPCPAGSRQTVTVDQRPNSGRWNDVATVTVSQATAEVKVRVRRDSSRPGWILADGARLLKVATRSSTESASF